MPPQPQQAYYTAIPPQGQYIPQPAPYKEESKESGAPWWIFFGVGVLAGQILAKVCHTWSLTCNMEVAA